MESPILSFIKRVLKAKTKKAKVEEFPSEVLIPRQEHCVSKNNINANALKVLNRLHANGYCAFLVGGSVRDLLMRKTPKDFDIVTDAHPQDIRKLFKNSRIIGRRFRLVHVFFHREIIEVATFRKAAPDPHDHKTNTEGMIVRDNVFGEITDDAWRRDLTINALYYNIKDSSIIDYTGGFKDLNNKIVKIIGTPTLRYQEDPVRILRAIRFAAKFDFQLEAETEQAIAETRELLTNVSSSRVFEEINKLYHCGNASKVQALLLEHHLFELFFPLTQEMYKQNPNTETLIKHTLANTDDRVNAKKPVTPAFFYAIFLWHPLLAQTEKFQEQGNPPLVALENAMNVLLNKQTKRISIPKRYAQTMREMWFLQFRFPKRYGNRAFKLLEHPRFRAAYDFLLLRTMTGEEDESLVNWWTEFQQVDIDKRKQMVKAINKRSRKK